MWCLGWFPVDLDKNRIKIPTFYFVWYLLKGAPRLVSE